MLGGLVLNREVVSWRVLAGRRCETTSMRRSRECSPRWKCKRWYRLWALHHQSLPVFHDECVCERENAVRYKKLKIPWPFGVEHIAGIRSCIVIYMSDWRHFVRIVIMKRNPTCKTVILKVLWIRMKLFTLLQVYIAFSDMFSQCWHLCKRCNKMS